MGNLIVFFGKPDAGKGTRLSEFLEGREDEFEVLSVGRLLKKVINTQTGLGKRAKSYMDSGQLVPDEIINEIVISYFKDVQKPILSDAFPRTIPQAKAMLESGFRPSIVIELYVDDEIVIERSHISVVCKSCVESYTVTGFKVPKVKGICDKCGSELMKRADDEESIVRTRLEVYRKETYPVLQFLKDTNIPVVTIDNTDLSTPNFDIAKLIDSL